MKRSELTEFAVEEEGFKLKIRRAANGAPIVVSGQHGSPLIPVAAEPAVGLSSASAPLPTDEEPGIAFIKSPMVGTFYRAPTPESKPFVEIGAKVTESSVICIIEAMK